MDKLKSIKDLKDFRTRVSEEVFIPDKNRIRLCCGTACTATGSGKVVKMLENEISKKGLNIEIIKTGCQGLCQKGPNEGRTVWLLLSEDQTGKRRGYYLHNIYSRTSCKRTSLQGIIY